jgi:RNA polymerase sigma-70 factor (ECF subfamily)
VVVEKTVFGRFLSRLEEPPAIEHAGDVYLACACALGVPRALEAFDRVLSSSVARGVARIDPSRAFADLVAQELRARLLLGDPPKIAGYQGRAPLATWLKTAAVRAALNLGRGRAEQRHESVSSKIHDPDRPEVAFARTRYRAAFEEALRLALRDLPARDRELLCASVRDRASIDVLAETYGVGRSTAARWLAAARERLTASARRVLQEKLRLTPSELDSLAAEVRSDVDVSIVRLLEEG